REDLAPRGGPNPAARDRLARLRLFGAESPDTPGASRRTSAAPPLPPRTRCSGCRRGPPDAASRPARLSSAARYASWLVRLSPPSYLARTSICGVITPLGERRRARGRPGRDRITGLRAARRDSSWWPSTPASSAGEARASEGFWRGIAPRLGNG